MPDSPPAEKTESVIVSIVTWNHAASIVACLESIFRQTRRPDEVHVFDNASHDQTRVVLDRFCDRVELKFNSENIGFCCGHNFIINSSESDFIFLVNPDIVMEPHWIERALEAMHSDAKVGTVCGLLLQNEEVIDGTGLLFSRSRRFLLRDHGKRRSKATRGPGEVFGADGALPLFRRAMIDDVSLDGSFFDPEFFAHKEDHDIAWRSRLFGWKTFFQPECVAFHPRVFRPGDLALRKTLAPEMKYHAVKNDLIMLLKNEACASFLRDCLWIVPRRIGIAFYSLFFERRSFAAYGYVVRHLQRILRQRKQIQTRRRVSAASSSR